MWKPGRPQRDDVALTSAVTSPIGTMVRRPYTIGQRIAVGSIRLRMRERMPSAPTSAAPENVQPSCCHRHLLTVVREAGDHGL